MHKNCYEEIYLLVKYLLYLIEFVGFYTLKNLRTGKIVYEMKSTIGLLENYLKQILASLVVEARSADCDGS